MPARVWQSVGRGSTDVLALERDYRRLAMV
jgi:hypothetical protein